MHSYPDVPERRKFFVRLITSIHAIIGGSIAVVLGGAVLSPLFGRRQDNWLTAANLALHVAEGRRT